MEHTTSKSTLKTSLSLGFFLALRQVRRSSIGTTASIIFVMMLTFLNLVVVRGVLVGLIQSSSNVFKEKYAGDIIISNLPKRTYIEGSTEIISIVKNLPWLVAYSPRYTEGGVLEGTYKERIDFTEEANTTSGVVTGINPALEDQTTGISSAIIEGRFLRPDDTDAVVVGANLLKKYYKFTIQIKILT